MKTKGLVITTVVIIMVLLVGSTVYSHTAEAKKSKYKANVEVRLDSNCWDKVVVELNDGIGGKTLAKKTIKGDRERDDFSALFADATLKFDGRKVHSGQIQLYTFNDFGSSYDYTDFKKSKHTYNFKLELPTDCGA